ncbi:MAG TPA: hypothetical protein PKM21_03670 [Anaerolineales bacterium]|nr:hypothetical protein [Anaerolineales bacterium]
MRGHTSRGGYPRLGILLCLACLLGAACGPVPTVDAPAAPQPILVAYRPAVQPMLARLQACGANEPSIALYAQPNVRPLAEIKADIILTLGDDGLQETSYTATLLGEERLVVIVNANNLVARMTGQELQAIYSAETSTWQTNRPDTEIRAWTYTSQEGPRGVFESAVMGTAASSGRVLLAADPQVMLEAVAGSANAIGYLPAAWLQPGANDQAALIHTIQLDESLADQMAMPILALTTREPGDLIRELLLCSQGQE